MAVSPPSPPPPAHVDPAERTATTTAPSSSVVSATKQQQPNLSQESTTPLENDAARHPASPPAQTEEAVSTSSSSLSLSRPQHNGAVQPASSPMSEKRDAICDQRSPSSSSSNDGEEDNQRSGNAAPQKRRKDKAAGLFALGGSRFDILINGSHGDGAACRKSEVRKAEKICSNGKDALQRGQEDLLVVAGEQMEASAQRGSRGEDGVSAADAVGGSLASPPPPAPPLGTSCGIPSRAPFKRLLAQPFSHILVCDFEATCASGSVHYPHEIIEFPVVVLDTATLRIVAEFHRYVRPVRNPKLTAFCTELTGITQEMVDAADTLPAVVEQFQQWLETEIYPLCAVWSKYYGSEKLSHNLKSEQKRFVYDDRTAAATANAGYEAMICVATDGPWDMRRFMHECSVLRDGVDFPPLCYRYINVRHSYSDHFKCRQIKLTHMLKKMSMSFEGRRHSGIADTRNITRVLAELMARGYRVHHVSTIKYSHRGDAFLESNQVAQELLSEYGEMDQTHTGRHNSAHKKTDKRGGGKK